MVMFVGVWLTVGRPEADAAVPPMYTEYAKPAPPKIRPRIPTDSASLEREAEPFEGPAGSDSELIPLCSSDSGTYIIVVPVGEVLET